MSDYFAKVSGSSLSKWKRRSTWFVAFGVVGLWTYYDYKKQIKKMKPEDNVWNPEDAQKWNAEILARQKNAKLLKEQRIAEQKAELAAARQARMTQQQLQATTAQLNEPQHNDR